MRTLIVREYEFIKEHDDVIEKINNNVDSLRPFTVDYFERNGIMYVRVSRLVEWQCTKGTGLFD